MMDGTELVPAWLRERVTNLQDHLEGKDLTFETIRTIWMDGYQEGTRRPGN